jgi:hypothetical protein
MAWARVERVERASAVGVAASGLAAHSLSTKGPPSPSAASISLTAAQQAEPAARPQLTASAVAVVVVLGVLGAAPLLAEASRPDAELAAVEGLARRQSEATGTLLEVVEAQDLTAQEEQEAPMAAVAAEDMPVLADRAAF